MSYRDVLDVLRNDRVRRRILADALILGFAVSALVWWQGGVFSTVERTMWSVGAFAVFVPVRIYGLAHRERRPPTRSTYVRLAIAWAILIVTWLLLYFVVL